MTDTPNPTGVFSAIAKITAKLAKDGISKDRKNQQQGYSFRGIEDVYQALAPLLAEHSLCIIPDVLLRTETERQTKSGGILYSVVVQVRFHMVSALDGSTAHATVWGEAMDSADKATNKAMSAAYKYMAFMTFCIPVDGSDDPDAVTPEETRRQPLQSAKARNKPSPVVHDGTGGVPIDKTPVTGFAMVEEAVQAICEATSMLSLQVVGHKIAASGFKGSDAEMARQAYAERRTEIQGPA